MASCLQGQNDVLVRSNSLYSQFVILQVLIYFSYVSANLGAIYPKLLLTLMVIAVAINVKLLAYCVFYIFPVFYGKFRIEHFLVLGFRL